MSFFALQRIGQNQIQLEIHSIIIDKIEKSHKKIQKLAFRNHLQFSQMLQFWLIIKKQSIQLLQIIKTPEQKMNPYSSLVYDEKMLKIRYPTSGYKRFNQASSSSSTQPQEIYRNKLAIQNSQKIAYQFPIRNLELLSQVSKSETFIHPQQKHSFSRMDRDKIKLKKLGKIQIDRTSEKVSDAVTTQRDFLEEGFNKSLQFLMGSRTNAYKTQYSKLARRKQTIIKRNLYIEQSEKIQNDHKNRQFQQFSEDKLIQKYRQLMNQKNKPFNLVNRLYQNEILSTKQMPLSSKQKAVFTKIQQNDKDIEEKIKRIVSKPTDFRKIRNMLLENQDSQYPYKINEKTSSNRTVQNGHIVNRLTPPDRKSQKKTTSTQPQHSNSQPAQPVNRRQNDQFLSIKLQNQQTPSFNALKQPPPIPKKLSCSSFIIYQISKPSKQKIAKISIQLSKKKQYQQNIHASLNTKITSEIASLTKIMTCIVAIEICEKLGVDPLVEKYKIGIFQSFVKGTSADIEPGDIYTIHELLHGLMLPSGNDASMALARWGGNVLLLSQMEASKRKQELMEGEPYSWASSNKLIKHAGQKLKAKRCYNRFIAEMNRKARLLSMQRTTYINSHGLSNALGRSCCMDLALLCQFAMSNPYFCSIVCCKEFSSIIDKQVEISQPIEVKSKPHTSYEQLQGLNLQADAQDQSCDGHSDDQQYQLRQSSNSERHFSLIKKEIRWANTHKLLHERQEYIGIKTGVTATAGPCLASCISLKDRKFIIIVLNSKKMSMRFSDTEALKHWLAKKEKIAHKTKLQDIEVQGDLS